MKRLVAIFMASATLAIPLAARADAPSSSDGVSAQLFFQRGRDAAARGDATEACRNFEESLRLDLAVGTLFNLARCEEDLGRLASAWQHLREGIDRLEESDARRGPALTAEAALEKRVPRLAVRLAPAAKGRVFRDGVELTSLSLGVLLPVNPGPHVVTVQSEGHAEAKYTIHLAPSARETLTVLPGALAVGAGAPPRRSTVRTAGWITGGVGVASLGVGLVTAALAFERSNVVHGHCDESGVCDERGLAALDSSKDFALLSTVTLVTGAGLLGAGIVMWILGKPDVEVSPAAMRGLVRF